MTVVEQPEEVAIGEAPHDQETVPPSLWKVDRRHLAVLFLVVLGIGVLFAGGHSDAIDNEVQFQTTRSLAQFKRGLESVDSVWVKRSDGPYRRVDGENVGIVGVGLSVVSAPIYDAARALSVVVPADQRDQFLRTSVFFTNALLLAGGAVVVAMLSYELAARRGASLFLGYAFALATYALPNSKTYFTEIGTAFFVALGALLAIRAFRTGSLRQFAASGAALGFAVMVRPSAALFIPIVGIAVIAGCWARRSFRASFLAALTFGAGAVALLVVFAALNWWRFGSPTDLGYQTVNQSFPIVRGVADQLFSPGKSFFLYAPIAALAPVGFVVAVRRLPFELLTLAGIVAVNFGFFGRAAFWSGDAAFGPRYALIVLPCVVAMAAPALRWLWARWTAIGLTAIGAIVAILGSLVYFNVFYVAAYPPLAGNLDRTHSEMAWNPVLGQVEELPEAVRESLGWERSGDPHLPTYSSDPTTHYGYFTAVPRLDFWWLWVGPTRGSPITYLYLLVPAGCFAGAFVLARRGRRPRPRGTPTPEGSSSTPTAEVSV